MSTIIQANYETLEALAARFGQHAEATYEMAQAVQRAQQQLQDGGWIGRGSEAFYAEMENDVTPAVYRLIDALLQASHVTKEISRMFQGADEEASSPFRSGTSADGGSGSMPSGGSGNSGIWNSDGQYNPGAADSNNLQKIIDRNGFTGGGGAGGGMPSGTDGIGFPLGGNDYGIPHDWLDGVTDSLQDYMRENYGDQGLRSDWLDGVKETLGLGGGSGGSSGSSGGGSAADMGSSMGGSSGSAGSGSTGGGMGSGGMGSGSLGSGGGMGGGMGSGSGMPSSGMGMPSSQSGGFPSGASGAHSGSRVSAGSAQSAMRYQSLSGGGTTGGNPAASFQSAGGSSGAGTPPTGTNVSSMGIPVGIAVASPFLALLGKAIRKRSED